MYEIAANFNFPENFLLPDNFYKIFSEDFFCPGSFFFPFRKVLDSPMILMRQFKKGNKKLEKTASSL